MISRKFFQSRVFYRPLSRNVASGMIRRQDFHSYTLYVTLVFLLLGTLSCPVDGWAWRQKKAPLDLGEARCIELEDFDPKGGAVDIE